MGDRSVGGANILNFCKAKVAVLVNGTLLPLSKKQNPEFDCVKANYTGTLGRWQVLDPSVFSDTIGISSSEKKTFNSAEVGRWMGKAW